MRHEETRHEETVLKKVPNLQGNSRPRRLPVTMNETYIEKGLKLHHPPPPKKNKPFKTKQQLSRTQELGPTGPFPALSMPRRWYPHNSTSTVTALRTPGWGGTRAPGPGKRGDSSGLPFSPQPAAEGSGGLPAGYLAIELHLGVHGDDPHRERLGLLPLERAEAHAGSDGPGHGARAHAGGGRGSGPGTFAPPRPVSCNC